MNSSRHQQLNLARERMGEHFTPNQLLGRTHTIGCVAVEITQKCNLDCTLCYLSEHSQAVKDIPLEEVFRRLNEVVKHYGTGASVQITGGDPTLRKHTELIEIVDYASKLGLHTALFTNGIAATRKLLTSLVAVGLKDVAFHVDTTQGRKGYSDEASLNTLRHEYIERAKGLGLMVIFNTTLHTHNFHELPDLVKFFVKNAAEVSFVSFQLQAETGRGEWGSRADIIDLPAVKAGIENALGKAMPWEKVRIGHQNCHSYMPSLVTNGQAFSVVDDEELFARFIADFAHIHTRRQDGVLKIIKSYSGALLRRPAWIFKLLRASLKKFYEMKWDLIKSGGKAHKLSFFVQNFMDAEALEQDRIDACSFMVMTAEGPVSMCYHNAHRDDYIFQPLRFVNTKGELDYFEPLPRNFPNNSPQDSARVIPIKPANLPAQTPGAAPAACGGCGR